MLQAIEFCSVLIFLWFFTPGTLCRGDGRNVSAGRVIPSEGYCDQPYVVVNEDGSWTCVMTTGKGGEGTSGQHIVSLLSTDRGMTWTKPVSVEPADGPEASWALPLKVPWGRIYVFYTYNAENMREVIADTEYAGKRVDTLGEFMFRFSDDNGRTWSGERFRIPVRLMDIDRRNPYGGRVMFFWGVGKPIVHEGTVYLGFSKVGRFGKGFIAESQGCFLKSDNILVERDPRKIRWETLPAGDTGLVAPAGPIAEETSIVGMSDGSLYCTYRTVDGHPCHAYSRDGGATWTAPAYMTYTPGGKTLKHPRAANFVWRASNGKYLYWFHNHGGRDYDSRNPAWLCGGVEKDGFIYWSQPEIVLYDDCTGNRMSYPDFIEQDGRYYITETQKSTARVHEIAPSLLEGLWSQFEGCEVSREGLLLDVSGKGCPPGTVVPMPRLPLLSFPGKAGSGGFTLDFKIRFNSLERGQVVFDSRDPSGKGILVRLTDRKTIALTMNGALYALPGGMNSGLGSAGVWWDCDPGLLDTDGPHHVTIIVDGGPGLISFIVDGVFCDGGNSRRYGWSRFDRRLRDVNGAVEAAVAPRLDGELEFLRLYGRALRTSEAVGNFRAGCGTSD